MTDQVIIALSTCPDEATTRRLAETLVTERLATCVNRLPGVTSTYFWDGRLQDEAEILLIIETTAARQAELQARLKASHPYERVAGNCSCIAGISAVRGGQERTLSAVGPKRCWNAEQGELSESQR